MQFRVFGIEAVNTDLQRAVMVHRINDATSGM
jgi:hypothetical protein